MGFMPSTTLAVSWCCRARKERLRINLSTRVGFKTPPWIYHSWSLNPVNLVAWTLLDLLNPFTARLLGGAEFCNMTLTFESVDEILWCDHSNEISLPVLSHSAICFSKFYRMKFANLVEICLWLHLAVKGLRGFCGEHINGGAFTPRAL